MGPQPVMLLGGGRTSWRWGLVEGNQAIWACSGSEHWDPGPFLCGVVE